MKSTLNLVPTTAQIRSDAFQILLQQIQWTAYDFICDSTVFGATERQHIAAQWTRSFPPKDDFCYTDELSSTTILAERLSWDSVFFGYDIVRLNTIISPDNGSVDYAALLKIWLSLLQKRNAKYVLAIIFPEDVNLVQTLGKCGFEVIESRITFHQKIAELFPSERFPVRLATLQDIDLLGTVAAEMANPFDRFHADPFIPRYVADRLMREWVRASIEDVFADFVVIPDVQNPRAFCTVKSHLERWQTWGVNLAQSVVLGAVDPKFKGWYRKLIAESNFKLAELGAEHVFWKTQSTNRAAIRTAEKLGYRLGRCELVFRLIL